MYHTYIANAKRLTSASLAHHTVSFDSINSTPILFAVSLPVLYEGAVSSKHPAAASVLAPSRSMIACSETPNSSDIAGRHRSSMRERDPLSPITLVRLFVSVHGSRISWPISKVGIDPNVFLYIRWCSGLRQAFVLQSRYLVVFCKIH
jgi:hypothetical protein